MLQEQLTVDTKTDDVKVPEPNLVRVMSPLLTPSSRTTKALSCIFNNKKALVLAEAAEKEMKNKSAFPVKHQYSGYLSLRIDGDDQWYRKYFVLSNNFLFGGDTQYSTKLSVCIALEGCNTKLTAQSSDMTFELNKYYFRANSPQLCKEWIANIERASTLTIYDIYRFRYELGTSSSSHSKVIAAKHKITNQEYAIKIMNKKKCNDKKTLQREINILKKLRSPYIVELCDLFETTKYLYIVMEFCKGGELFDQIANMDYLNGDRYTEKDCIGIMHQLAAGVQYMHDMGIVHRDLKPENILCVETNSIKKIKIADFGISAVIDPNRLNGISATRPKSTRSTKALNHKRFSNSSTHSITSNNSQFDALNILAQNQNNMMKTRVGTLSYTAPEILKYKPYDEKVDYWSLGVIMYILVCGYPPFGGDNDYDLSDEIINEEVPFDEEDWTHVGQQTQDLIERLLDKNPRRRANCMDIIEHSWKIDVKNAGFMKAHNKFKQTVFKRKIITRSRANTANTTTTNNEDSMLSSSHYRLPSKSFDNTPFHQSTSHLIKERMFSLMELNINALDDSVLKQKRNNKMNVVQFDSEQKESQIAAWKVGSDLDKPQSKTTEYLELSHMTQIHGNKDAVYLNENIMDDLPDFPSLNLLSYSNRSSIISSNTDINTILSPTFSMTVNVNRSRKNTGNSSISISTPTSGSSGSDDINGIHCHSPPKGRLSLLSSKSFLESFSNKRKSITKYKRSSNNNNNKSQSNGGGKRRKRTGSTQRRFRKQEDIDKEINEMLNANDIHGIHGNINHFNFTAPNLQHSWSIMEETEDTIDNITDGDNITDAGNITDAEVVEDIENDDNDKNEMHKPHQIKVQFYVNDEDDEDDDDEEKEINNYAIPNFSSIDSPSPLITNIIYNESNPTSPDNDNGIDISMLQSLNVNVQTDDDEINDDNYNNSHSHNHETHKNQIISDYEFVDTNYINIKHENGQFSSI